MLGCYGQLKAAIHGPELPSPAFLPPVLSMFFMGGLSSISLSLTFSLSLSFAMCAHVTVGGTLWSHFPFHFLWQSVTQLGQQAPAAGPHLGQQSSALLFILNLKFYSQHVHVCAGAYAMLGVWRLEASAGCLLSPSTSSLGQGFFTEARAHVLPRLTG